MVVFDIGANIGYYTLMISRLIAPDGMVHSFEAATSTYNRLKEHIHINNFNNILFHHSAVSDNNGQSVIYCADESNTGESRLESFKGFKKKESVNCITLDTYIEKEAVEKVDFIKIDVEGAEMLVIKGALSLLNNYRPVVMLEINPLYLSRMGSDVTTLISTITDIGYNMFHFQQGALEPCININPVLKGKENVNVVFIPNKE
jgi:FkbM family methyltransferase